MRLSGTLPISAADGAIMVVIEQQTERVGASVFPLLSLGLSMNVVRHMLWRVARLGCVAMRIQDISISIKLTATALAAAGAAIMCVVVAFVLQDLRLINDIKDEQVASQSTLLASNLAALMNSGYPSHLPELLQGAASEHGIVAAAVVSPEGTLLTTFNLPDVLLGVPVSEDYLEALVDKLPERHAATLHITPILLSNGSQAQLITYVSHLDIKQRIEFMLGYSMMAIVLAMLIALAISWLVQRMVSTRLLNLSDLSRRIKQTGDYSLRATLTGGDEIGLLAQVFNEMLEQIAVRDRNLERQVRRRTHELEGLADAFRYRALHDTLTGLPNRALLQEEFCRAAAHANRCGNCFALLLLDIDNFKSINDNFGHEFGDELLRQVASDIRVSVRGEDRVCRLGGDEFTVLMEDLSNESMAVQIGRNLLKDLSKVVVVQNQKIHVTVSVGVSIYPKHGCELSTLKFKADIAMYKSKELGKNRLTLFGKSLEKEVQHRQLVQSDLAKAIRNDQLELYFQPQVDMEHHKLVAVEALLRWNNTQLGLLSPAEFLGFTCDSHLIRATDCYVIHAACRQVADWQEKYQQVIPIGVSLAAIHLLNVDIVQIFEQKIREFRLNGSAIIVELPELLLAEDDKKIRRVALQLREMGLRIALNNFGVGGSSLDYIRSFPMDIIKMDKSFSMQVHNREKDRKLVKGIVALAQECDVLLVAEGVESELQATTLATLGCHVMQGRWYTKPCETLMFEHWLDAFAQTHAA